MDWFIGKARRKDKDSTPAQQEETKQYLHAAMLECTTSEKELREIINLNEGLDYNEWLASHTIAFFDHINLLYGTISEFCSMSGCPEMSGPCNRQYQWLDEKGKRVKVAAPQYIDYVMTYTQKTVNDESIFPTKFDKEFPPTFELVVKKIMRLLYHVVAHIYHSHFKEIVLLNLHPHLNCIFAHLVLYNERFKLIDDKELEVLHDLAVALKLYPPNTTAALVTDPTTASCIQLNVDVDVVDNCDRITQDMNTPTHNDSPNTSSSSHDPNNNTKVSSRSGDVVGDDGVITTQCRSISPFDAYPTDDVDLIDSSEMKENEDRYEQFVNSPMLVDDNDEGGGLISPGSEMLESTPMKINDFPSKVGSPEPMMIEPMTSLENIPKKQPFISISSPGQLRVGRSMSANAVLSTSTRSLDLAFSTSPHSRRCNSDRTSAKSIAAMIYASPGSNERSTNLNTSCGR